MRLKFKSFFWYVVLFLCVIPFITVIRFPPDDYWRHLASIDRGFDYSKLYIYSWLPAKNLYIGYDVFLSILYRVFGVYSFIPVQILVILIYALAFYVSERETKYPEVAVSVFMVMMSFVMLRTVTARPAVVAASLFYLIWCGDERAGEGARVLVSSLYALFSPFYWLNFIYIIPLVLFRSRVYLVSLAGFICFWTLYMGVDYFDAVYHHITVFRYRPFPVFESNLPHHVLISPLLFLLYVVRHYVFLDLKTLLAAFYFTLTLQVRYVYEAVIPLVALSVRHLDREIVKKGLAVVMIFVSFSFASISMVSRGSTFPSLERTCSVCDRMEGKRVLVLDFNTISFALSYLVKDVKITPAMEIAWTEPDILNAMKDLHRGRGFSCELFKKYDYDYVVEDKLKETPPCLKPAGWVDRYRVWGVVKH